MDISVYPYVHFFFEKKKDELGTEDDKYVLTSFLVVLKESGISANKTMWCCSTAQKMTSTVYYLRSPSL